MRWTECIGSIQLVLECTLPLDFDWVYPLQMVFNYVPNIPHPMTIVASSHSSKHASGSMNIGQCRTTMMHEESEMVISQP